MNCYFHLRIRNSPVDKIGERLRVKLYHLILNFPVGLTFAYLIESRLFQRIVSFLLLCLILLLTYLLTYLLMSFMLINIYLWKYLWKKHMETTCCQKNIRRPTML